MMSDLELLAVVVAMGAVLLAAVSAFIEHTSAKHDEPGHRRVLEREPRYREHRRRRR
jgi:hypothetical protein